MIAAGRPPEAVLGYGALLTEQLLGLLPEGILAVYLHGSAVLGGWRAGISDIDLLIVLTEQVSPETAHALGQATTATVADCPGTGLEMSAVCQAEAANPRAPWRFVVHAAASRTDEPKIVLGQRHPGDPDLLLHYAVCRAAGWPVLGPPAARVIGPVPRPAVLHALAAELAWGVEHAPAPYALLNACRALRYQHHGELVAKTTGGRWALERDVGPRESISRALAAQRGDQPATDLTAAEITFIQHAAHSLTTAARCGRESNDTRPAH